MSDEFKKLDQLLREQRPATRAPKQELKLPPSTRWLLPSALAFSLTGFVIFQNIQRQQTNLDNSEAVYESLSWDLTADEMGPELEAEFEELD